MPEIVQAYGAGEPSALENRLEAPGRQIPCAHRIPHLVGEYEPAILSPHVQLIPIEAADVSGSEGFCFSLPSAGLMCTLALCSYRSHVLW